MACVASALCHPIINGRAEVAVKSMKRLLQGHINTDSTHGALATRHWDSDLTSRQSPEPPTPPPPPPPPTPIPLTPHPHPHTTHYPHPTHHPPIPHIPSPPARHVLWVPPCPQTRPYQICQICHWPRPRRLWLPAPLTTPRPLWVRHCL